MVLSLPPILVLLFWSAGIVVEETVVRKAVFEEIGALVGEDGAEELMATMGRITAEKPTRLAAFIGIGTLAFMASTVFVTVKTTLNRIFRVELDLSVRENLLMMLLDRLLSIAVIAVLSLILVISLLISTLITAFGEAIVAWLGPSQAWLLVLDTALLNLIVLTPVFAETYRYIPDRRLPWRDSWFGGLFTASLFIVGRSVIALVIGNSELAGLYDAARSLLVFMLCVYYSAAMFYFGATITHVRAEQRPLDPLSTPAPRACLRRSIRGCSVFAAAMAQAQDVQPRSSPSRRRWPWRE